MIAKSLEYLLSLSSSAGKTQKLIILIYHRVFDRPDDMYPHQMHVSTFDWQMALLAARFNVLSLADALACLESNSLPPRAVCITFDDGYADNYVNALPILKRYGLPATFFVVAGMVDQDRMWRDDVVEAIRRFPGSELDLRFLNLGTFSVASLTEKVQVAKKLADAIKYLPLLERTYLSKSIADLVPDLPNRLMLSSQQIQLLCDDGMEIGSHTISHPILNNMSVAEWQNEIFNSKVMLENIVKEPIRFFAYPNGKLNDDFGLEHSRFVRECGYEAGLSTNWGCVTKQTNRWMLPRFTPWDNTPNRFMLRMADMYWRG